MDPITTAIITVLAAGTAAVLNGAAEEVGKDAYNRLKSLLAGRLTSLGLLEQDPTNDAFRKAAEVEAANNKLGEDPEIAAAARDLSEALAKQPPERLARIGVDVRALQAGTDILIRGNRVPVKADNVVAGGKIDISDNAGTDAGKN